MPKTEKVDVWIDMKNSHEPAFFSPFLEWFDKKGLSWFVTARDYAEVTGLLDARGIPYVKVGRHYGASLIAKGLGRLVLRNAQIARVVPRMRFALSHMSPEANQLGRLRGATTISFYDNELPQLSTKVQMPFVDHLFIPEAIEPARFEEQGARPSSITRYPGFKEDLYLAGFSPEDGFVDKLGVRDYVVVRPEARKAEYYPKGEASIVPALLDSLASRELPVLFLPRYPEDRRLAAGAGRITIPYGALNGLDICQGAKAVLTGSGTMAREAAILGVPAVQFIPGPNLAVDRELQRRGWLLHSRDPALIAEYVETSGRRRFDQARCRAVAREVFKLLELRLSGSGSHP
jgi:hypothetical protein